MDQGGNFRPGRPLNPYFGYSTPARAMDYPLTVNTAIQGRAAWGRVAYETLKKVYDTYDVARMCVNHKIDELRSMEPMFLPADGVKDDVDDEIEVARLVLDKPDRELPYEAWLSKWLEGAIKYDSAPLYRRRDYNGDVIGLEVVDGKTIFPYIDQNGRRPRPEPGDAAPPAFAQIIHGMVGTWFTDDDIIYVPFRPQEDSPYGMSPLETLLFTANTDLRFQWHFLQLFTDGSVPAGFMEVPPDISSPDQVAEWQDYWDAMVMGDQAKLHQLLAVPSGSKFTQTKPAAFDAKFPEYLMRRCCAGHGVVPQDLGFVSDVNRANGETQTDIQFRVNTLPWVRYVQGVLTRYLQRDIGLRVQVKLDTGRDKEDRLQEAQAHQLYVEMGAESPDEVRSEVLGLPVDKERPTPRFVMVERVGPIPLLAIEGVAGRTDPETHGPAKDQPVLDQPYVPPVGVIATPGTTDDKAALAATDQYQIYTRHTLEQEQGETPARESRGQKRQRGAKAEQEQARARSEADADQQAPGEPAAPGGAPVAKSIDGEEAGELLAFRAFTAVRRRRGTWDRDFEFQHVSPAIARRLNAGARAEVLKAAAKPAALEHADPVARKVYDQLLADFPPDAIRWVLDQRWDAEQLPLDAIDWDHVHTWTATHQPGKVAKLAKKMAKGGGNRRAIAVARPGKPTVMLADGHHHAEAHRLLGEPVPAFVAHVGTVKGPWDEMHASQDPASDVTKAHGTPGLTARSGMISLDLEPGTIPAVPSGVDDHHITVVYLGPDVTDDQFERACQRAQGAANAAGGPIEGSVGGIGSFPPSDGSGGLVPAFAEVDVPEARNLYVRLKDLSASGRRTYVPHVTLAYLEPGAQLPEPVAPTPVRFTHLSVHRGEQVARFPLGGPEAVTKAEAVKAAFGPKASGRSSSADDWPGWEYDQEAAAYWAPRITAGLIGAFGAYQLAARFLGTQQGKTQQDQQAATLVAIAMAWLASLRRPAVRALAPVMEGLYTDGYLIGAASAQAYLAGQAAGQVLAADLAHWSPGDTGAARLLLGQWGDGAGLRSLLEQADVRITSIVDTRLDELGRILGQGVAEGLTADEIAVQIRDLLTNTSRALMIAQTEVTRAVAAAAENRYTRAGYLASRWLTERDARVCAICGANEERGAVAIGEPFPSGDLRPPAHPRCRCATVPAYVEE